MGQAVAYTQMNGRRADIYALVKALVGADTVIWADQNAPRPALPYWTLRLSSRRSIGWDDYGQGVDTLGTETIGGVREETLEVQCLGADAFDKVCAVRDALAKRTVQAAWYATGLAIFDRGNVLNVPYKMDNEQLEPRGVMDLILRYAVITTDVVGAIETVNTTGEYAQPGTGTFLADENLDQTISSVYTGA